MSQPNDAASVWISVPIVKYSHVTITLNKRIPPWIHEPANTLTFVIQAVRVVDDEGKYERRVMMKIFRGAEVLVGSICFHDVDSELIFLIGISES